MAGWHRSVYMSPLSAKSSRFSDNTGTSHIQRTTNEARCCYQSPTTLRHVVTQVVAGCMCSPSKLNLSRRTHLLTSDVMTADFTPLPVVTRFCTVGVGAWPKLVVIARCGRWRYYVSELAVNARRREEIARHFKSVFQTPIQPFTPITSEVRSHL